MITMEPAPTRIVITQARQRFGRLRKRKQWQYSIVAPNGERIDPRDTYANPGDIRAVLARLIGGTGPIIFETHLAGGAIRREPLR